MDFMTTDHLDTYTDPLNELERKVFTLIAATPRITSKEIGEKIGVEKDMVSRVVKKLVLMGWVFERKNPEDRRFTQLGMTKKGEGAMYEYVVARYHKRPGTFKINGIRVWTGEDEPDPDQNGARSNRRDAVPE
jgi:predicted transcriptional regulator